MCEIELGGRESNARESVAKNALAMASATRANSAGFRFFSPEMPASGDSIVGATSLNSTTSGNRSAVLFSDVSRADSVYD